MKYWPLIILLCSTPVAASKSDREIRESRKCARYFKYFEKKYKIPRDTLHSISLHETGKAHSNRNIRMVWPWTINVEGKSYYLDNKHDAIKTALKHYRNNKSIDVGCMQINLNYHADGFKNMRFAFNPKHNVEFAAKFLRSHYDKTGNWHKAIAMYHSSTPHLGERYRNKVLAIADNIEEYKKVYRPESPAKANKVSNSDYWKLRKNRRAQHIKLSSQNEELQRNP